VSLSALLLYQVVLTQKLHATLLLLPVVAVPLVLLSLGLSWFLSGLGVYVRDVGYLVGLLVQVLLFATPVFYPVELVGPRLQVLFAFNPLAFVVENVRRVVLWGRLPDWSGLALWSAACAVVAVLGYAWFMKTKRGFADVL
jgi:lipopolysaccharide transport system permease protein